MKKGIYNVLAGIGYQLINIILGITLSRLILVNLGSEINGLVSSVGQILVYIGLLDAGIGPATLQALYRPVAIDDSHSICKILAATNKYYSKIGLIDFIILFALSLIYPLITTSTISYCTIAIVIILHGMNSIINFYFQDKYIILLRAEGKNYIIMLFSITTKIAIYTSQIILILLHYNIIALQIVSFAVNCMQTVGIMVYVKHNYPWLDLNIKPDYNAIIQKNSVFIHQISEIIFNNTDTLIITLICGFKIASVYVIYALFFGFITTSIRGISNSLTYKLGQTFHSDMEKFYRLHDIFELYSMTLAFSVCCVANVFILPFIKIYTLGITDVNYVDIYLPHLFAAVCLLSSGRISSNQVITYAGHFKLTQWHSVLESIINITVSVIGAFHLGIYGILLGTVIALLYRTNDIIIYANKRILHRSPWITYKRWFINLVVFVVITFLSHCIPWDLGSYNSILFGFVIYSMVIIPVFFMISSLFDIVTAKNSIRYLTRFIVKKRRR